MLYKNMTTNETTNNRGLAWAWYRKGHGDAIEIYRYNSNTNKWDLLGGWTLVA